jgi:hypothetical protein
LKSTDYLKWLKLALAYSELPKLDKILQACGFYPVKNYKDESLYLKKWIDSNNNLIDIRKKRIDLSPNLLNIECKSYDLYGFLDFKSVLKITNKVLIIKCSNEKTSSFYFNCYCIDNNIRSFIVNNKVTRISPIYSTYSLLIKLFDNKYYSGKCDIIDFDLYDSYEYVCCKYPFQVEDKLTKLAKKVIKNL